MNQCENVNKLSEDETLKSISKYERNKKIREGHRETAKALEQDAAILIRRSEFIDASDVLATLSSISKILKRKLEYLAAPVAYRQGMQGILWIPWDIRKILF